MASVRAPLCLAVHAACTDSICWSPAARQSAGTFSPAEPRHPWGCRRDPSSGWRNGSPGEGHLVAALAPQALLTNWPWRVIVQLHLSVTSFRLLVLNFTLLVCNSLAYLPGFRSEHTGLSHAAMLRMLEEQREILLLRSGVGVSDLCSGNRASICWFPLLHRWSVNWDNLDLHWTFYLPYYIWCSSEVWGVNSNLM